MSGSYLRSWSRAALVVLLLASVLAAAPSAGAQVSGDSSEETCAGLPATIVGDGGKILGTPGDDVIVGTMGRETIRGFGGDDVICARGGDDVVYGGYGHDTIYGGFGHDTIKGGGGGDTVIAGAGNDTVFGGTGKDVLKGGPGSDQLTGGNGEDEILGGLGPDDVAGGWHADYISGGAGADHVRGGLGTDEVYGDDGNDIVVGGDGNDYVVGGNGTNVVRGGNGDDEVHRGNAVLEVDVPEPEDTPAAVSLEEPVLGDVCVDTSFGGQVLTGFPGVDDARSPTPVSLGDGEYTVVLTTTDPNHGLDDEADQTHEMWRLQGLNAQGEVVFETAATDDLPFGHESNVTNVGVVDASGVVAVVPVHGSDVVAANSLLPARAQLISNECPMAPESELEVVFIGGGQSASAPFICDGQARLAVVVSGFDDAELVEARFNGSGSPTLRSASDGIRTLNWVCPPGEELVTFELIGRSSGRSITFRMYTAAGLTKRFVAGGANEDFPFVCNDQLRTAVTVDGFEDGEEVRVDFTGPGSPTVREAVNGRRVVSWQCASESAGETSFTVTGLSGGLATNFTLFTAPPTTAEDLQIIAEINLSNEDANVGELFDSVLQRLIAESSAGIEVGEDFLLQNAIPNLFNGENEGPAVIEEEEFSVAVVSGDRTEATFEGVVSFLEGGRIRLESRAGDPAVGDGNNTYGRAVLRDSRGSVIGWRDGLSDTTSEVPDLAGRQYSATLNRTADLNLSDLPADDDGDVAVVLTAEACVQKSFPVPDSCEELSVRVLIEENREPEVGFLALSQGHCVSAASFRAPRPGDPEPVEIAGLEFDVLNTGAVGDICGVIDTRGNVASVVTTSEGLVLDLSVSAGLLVTNASTVQQLEGVSDCYGSSAGQVAGVWCESIDSGIRTFFIGGTLGPLPVGVTVVRAETTVEVVRTTDLPFTETLCLPPVSEACGAGLPLEDLASAIAQRVEVFDELGTFDAIEESAENNPFVRFVEIFTR